MSWWDREIHIWRLSQSSKYLQHDDPMVKSRKLVAKILLKGEASILSASLSHDGSMLAVSTIEETKLFRLKPHFGADGDALRVNKMSLPPSFATGARLLQFSPDNKWLCIISFDRITMARIAAPEDPDALPTVLSQHTSLGRIKRNVPKHVLLGGLGAYDRTITKVAFSSDSRLLIVSDLAGYIDSWVLSGHEDVAAGISETATPTSAESDSEMDSDAESVTGTKTISLIYNQHWQMSPNAKLLPKLPSTPVVVSFRPMPRSQLHDLGPIPHATRRTPHPISHNLPLGEDRLLVITASNEVFEFAVIKGALTPWSRRNPTLYFPKDYTRERDHAKGCIWDISQGRERAWVWSVNSLWMFDLGKDFQRSGRTKLVNGHDAGARDGQIEHEATETATTLVPHDKRQKLNSGHRSEMRNDNRQERSGAGDLIPSKELELGSGVAYTPGAKGTGKRNRLLDTAAQDAHAMDVDPLIPAIEGQAPQSLSNVRRAETCTDNDLSADHDSDRESKTNQASPAQTWNTYKYRPIVGVVVIGDEEDVRPTDDVSPSGTDVQPIGPEVAIVERPIWECDLPPRWYGDQEWEKNGT